MLLQMSINDYIIIRKPSPPTAQETNSAIAAELFEDMNQ